MSKDKPKVLFWLDTEFIDEPCYTDLISIGIVCQNDAEFYAINSDFDPFYPGEWVKDNVISKLEKKDNLWFSREEIAFNLAKYIKRNCLSPNSPSIEYLDNLSVEEVNDPDAVKTLYDLEIDYKPIIWGYYCAYDWFFLCKLYGNMINLPKGFPGFMYEIKQECNRQGNPQLPRKLEPHHALLDAKWNRQAYNGIVHTEKH